MAFTNHELKLCEVVRDVLKPIYTAQERMGKNDATLLTAEGCFDYIFRSLKKVDHPFAELMYQSVKKRFLERRNKALVSLMAYLKNRKTKLGSKDPIFPTASRKEVRSVAQSCMSRLFDVDIVTDEQETNLNLNYNETEDIDLNSCIAAHSECAQSEEKTNPNVYHLSKDMQWFEDTNTLTPNLKKLLDALNQMSPTSTPSEKSSLFQAILCQRREQKWRMKL